MYANPHAKNSSRKLNSLLDTTDFNQGEIEEYLDEKPEENEEPHFLDDIDITKDAIIYQSPFNVKVCARIPALNRLILKEKIDKQITNPLYSPKIVHLLHKWFAYVPLWSCIMTDFVDNHHHYN